MAVGSHDVVVNRQRSFSLPPSLQASAPVFARSSAVQMAAQAIFDQNAPGRFLVYLDDACRMPSDWRTHMYSRKSNTSNMAESGMATAGDAKYAAESLLPHMLWKSGFVTDDWRRANASVVMLYSHRYGGPILGPERCRRALAERSEACCLACHPWEATLFHPDQRLWPVRSQWPPGRSGDTAPSRHCTV